MADLELQDKPLSIDGGSSIGSTTANTDESYYTESTDELLTVKGKGLLGLVERIPLPIKLFVMCFLSVAGMAIFAGLFLNEKKLDLRAGRDSQAAFQAASDFGQLITYLQLERSAQFNSSNLNDTALNDLMHATDDIYAKISKKYFNSFKEQYGQMFKESLQQVMTAQSQLQANRDKIQNKRNDFPTEFTVILYYTNYIEYVLSMVSGIMYQVKSNGRYTIAYAMYLRLMEYQEQSFLYAGGMIRYPIYTSIVYRLFAVSKGTRDNFRNAWSTSVDLEMASFYNNQMNVSSTKQLQAMESYIESNGIKSNFVFTNKYTLGDWVNNCTEFFDNLRVTKDRMANTMEDIAVDNYTRAASRITGFSILVACIAVLAVISAFMFAYTIIGPWRRLNRLQENVISRFVSRGFLKVLECKSIVDVTLGKFVEKELTIMEIEIDDFSRIRKDMKPSEVFRFLNAYLKHVGPMIRKYGGFIDKFGGAKFRALFPDASRCARSSIAIHSSMDIFNEMFAEEFPRIQIHSSVHTGVHLIGTVGENERVDGTIISDHTQVTDQMDRLKKKFNCKVLMTKDTIDKCGKWLKEVHIRLLGSINIGSSEAKVEVYEVLKKSDLLKIASKVQFESAVREFNKGSFQKALDMFQTISYNDPLDSAAVYYLNKSKQLLEQYKYTVASLQLLKSLQDPELSTGFEQFCETEHSSENILLWREIQEFRKLKGNKEHIAMADTIVTKYFQMSSKYTVNVNEVAKERIVYKLQQSPDTVNDSLFDEIQVQLELNMTDTLKRYKSSPLFEEHFQRSSLCPARPSLEEL
jgi:class 3 adenylate cyclase